MAVRRGHRWELAASGRPAHRSVLAGDRWNAVAPLDVRHQSTKVNVALRPINMKQSPGGPFLSTSLTHLGSTASPPNRRCRTELKADGTPAQVIEQSSRQQTLIPCSRSWAAKSRHSKPRPAREVVPQISNVAASKEQFETKATTSFGS